MTRIYGYFALKTVRSRMIQSHSLNCGKIPVTDQKRKTKCPKNDTANSCTDIILPEAFTDHHSHPETDNPRLRSLQQSIDWQLSGLPHPAIRQEPPELQP